MNKAYFYIDGKPITVELPKPIPVTQRFNVIEALDAIRGRWLVIALVVMLVVGVVTGVEIK